MTLTEVLGPTTTAIIIFTRPKIMIIDHLKINQKVNRKRAVPIKVVNPNNIHSTSRRQVVKGRSITTAMAAIPQLRGKIESAKKVWKVLFDSGSDGDIAFIKRSDKASIDMHDQLRPLRWKTSNGIFGTNKVGNVLLTLPKFSISKIMSVRPDIQFIDEDQPPPMYGLIIGIERLAE